MRSDLSRTVAELISSAAGGGITTAEVEQYRDGGNHLGMSSLSQLKLLELIESEFGVFIEFDHDMSFLDTVGGIEHEIRSHLELTS